MKAFACGDVVPGCEARWLCASEDDILLAVARHARAVHGITAIGPELEASVRAAITSPAA